jgi:hypothetical protein
LRKTLLLATHFGLGAVFMESLSSYMLVGCLAGCRRSGTSVKMVPQPQNQNQNQFYFRVDVKTLKQLWATIGDSLFVCLGVRLSWV